MKNCYCGSGKFFKECCEPLIEGIEKAPTAEALMRSRYSAYCVVNVDYLLKTTHPKTRKMFSRESINEFATHNQWIKLEIINSSTNIVTFKAFYINDSLQAQSHYERSTFQQEDGVWYYVKGEY